MAGFPTQRVGPWAGINNIVARSELPPGHLHDAKDVNVAADGRLHTPFSWTQVASGSAHSLYTHDRTTYGVIDGVLHRFDVGAAVAVAYVTGELWWEELQGRATYADATGVYWLDPGPVPVPGAERQDEDDLDDALIPMPGGRYLNYWQGRLVVARGRRLIFSRPLRYGAHAPLLDYYTMPHKITWMVALEGGIYVGQPDDVHFLAGVSLAELSRRVVAGRSAPGVAARVAGATLGEPDAGNVAVWLTDRGFATGAPGGTVRYPQADRLRDLPLFRGRLAVLGTRVYALRG